MVRPVSATRLGQVRSRRDPSRTGWGRTGSIVVVIVLFLDLGEAAQGLDAGDLARTYPVDVNRRANEDVILVDRPDQQALCAKCSMSRTECVRLTSVGATGCAMNPA